MAVERVEQNVACSPLPAAIFCCMKKLDELNDDQLGKLIENRWGSSETVWDVVSRTYKNNLRVYQNNGAWIDSLPRQRTRVRANRVFPDMEAVINSLIANPPKPNVLPGRKGPESKNLAVMQEKYFLEKYVKLNLKEIMRKGLRNLYFGRLIVLKPFWDASINDFNVRAIDPRKVRFSKFATKEQDSEFAIEEITDTLLSVMRRFPKKAKDVMVQAGYTDEDQVLINNPTITYKEAWIRDYVIFKYDNLILGKTKNPYWDWDGLLVTLEEERELTDLGGESRKVRLQEIRAEQEKRKALTAQQMNTDAQNAVTDQAQTEPGELNDIPQKMSAYYFNHFDAPRKPYIFATIFNNENTPVGQTDMIEQATPLQEAIDRRKQDIDENASLVNGQVKVDASVMSKADAQKLRYEARGVIWGKGVATGVTREMGTPLPPFVYEDMIDSRNEIDNIMAASAAFRGEREGQETKAGRLALIDQSFLRLNELVQVVDYCSYELFNWFYQLAKVRYTEHHTAKSMGREGAVELLTIMQDDFEEGSEITVISGKSLPEDRQFKYEQAQVDVQQGLLSPPDYFEIAGYTSPLEKAQNRVIYDTNPAYAVGLSDGQLNAMAPTMPAPPAAQPEPGSEIPQTP